MADLVRAHAYLARAVRDGRRAAAFDEDPFTLAAAALERALVDRPSTGGPTRIHLVGDPMNAPDELFGYLVGRSVPVERTGIDGTALRAALAAASAASESAVVVAVAGGPHRPSAPDGPGDGAAAFRFEPGRGTSFLPDASGLGAPSATALGEAFRLPRGSSGPNGPWTGGWTEIAGSGPAAGPARDPSAVDVGAVSEGAYVPRARYLEGLPSRWRFEADRCPTCSVLTFPSRGVCRGCTNRAGLVPTRLPLDGGRVVAATEIGRGGQPTEFDFLVDALGPYGVVLVELAPGVRATLQVAEATPGELRPGARVGTRLGRLYPMDGEWRYGRKAVPLRGAAP